MLLRNHNKVQHKAEQWLGDALNVGTIIIVIALVAGSFPWWSVKIGPSQFTDIALIYCAGIIVANMRRSILKPTD
jgi:hypothetical protein